jgi:uncharacterized protein (DUF2252 family)
MAPPLIIPAQPEEFESIQLKFEEYVQSVPPYRRRLLQRYRLVDVARKVVGVGSVGTRCWIALFDGRDEQDPLFLQMKEATASVLEPWLGASEFDNHGERVVVGQRLTQAASDIFLGWSSDRDGRDYYWRQLWDMKGSVEPVTEPGLSAYATVCGWALARAHAKTGDAVSIAAYMGKGDRFVNAIATFADAYAQQTVKDHEALATAERKGRISAIHGL